MTAPSPSLVVVGLLLASPRSRLRLGQLGPPVGLVPVHPARSDHHRAPTERGQQRDPLHGHSPPPPPAGAALVSRTNGSSSARKPTWISAATRTVLCGPPAR